MRGISGNSTSYQSPSKKMSYYPTASDSTCKMASPLYTQSNGLAEQTAHTAKRVSKANVYDCGLFQLIIHCLFYLCVTHNVYNADYIIINQIKSDLLIRSTHVQLVYDDNLLGQVRAKGKDFNTAKLSIKGLICDP